MYLVRIVLVESDLDYSLITAVFDIAHLKLGIWCSAKARKGAQVVSAMGKTFCHQ